MQSHFMLLIPYVLLLLRNHAWPTPSPAVKIMSTNTSMDFEGFLIGAHKKLEDDSIASDYYGSFTGNSTLYQQLCGKNGVRN